MSELTPEQESSRTRLILSLISNEFGIKNSGSFLMEEVLGAISGFLISLKEIRLRTSNFSDHIDSPAAFSSENNIQKIFKVHCSYKVSEDLENALEEYINLFLDCTTTLHNDLLRSQKGQVSKQLTSKLREVRKFLGLGLDPTTPVEAAKPVTISFNKKEYTVKEDRSRHAAKIPVSFNKKQYSWGVSSPDDVIEIKEVKTSRGIKTKVIESIPSQSRSFNRTPAYSQATLFDRLTVKGRGLGGQSVRVRKHVQTIVDAAGFPICKVLMED
jgi:hypothetical protein